MSSGIGAATARTLAAEGFRVVCAARRAERLESLVAELGDAAVAVACDVTSDEDVARLAEVAGGRVHVLVNNAGGALGSSRWHRATSPSGSRCTTPTCSARCA